MGAGALYIKESVSSNQIAEYVASKGPGYEHTAQRLRASDITGVDIIHHRANGTLNLLFDSVGLTNKWHRAYLMQDVELGLTVSLAAYRIQCLYRGTKSKDLFSVVLRVHRERVRAATVLQRNYRAMKSRKQFNFVGLAALMIRRRRLLKAAAVAMEASAAVRNAASMVGSVLSIRGDPNKARVISCVRNVTYATTEENYIKHLGNTVAMVQKLSAMPRGLTSEDVLRPIREKRAKAFATGTWTEAVDGAYKELSGAVRTLANADDDGTVKDHDTVEGMDDDDGESSTASTPSASGEFEYARFGMSRQRMNEVLVESCRSGGYGNRVRVAQLLEAGADVHFSGHDWRGNTPLHYACMCGDDDMVRLLVKHGAQVNRRNRNGGNAPLHYAVFYAHPLVVQLLIDSGAEASAKNLLQSYAPETLAHYRNARHGAHPRGRATGSNPRTWADARIARTMEQYRNAEEERRRQMLKDDATYDSSSVGTESRAEGVLSLGGMMSNLSMPSFSRIGRKLSISSTGSDSSTRSTNSRRGLSIGRRSISLRSGRSAPTSPLGLAMGSTDTESDVVGAGAMSPFLGAHAITEMSDEELESDTSLVMATQEGGGGGGSDDGGSSVQSSSSPSMPVDDDGDTDADAGGGVDGVGAMVATDMDVLELDGDDGGGGGVGGVVGA